MSYTGYQQAIIVKKVSDPGGQPLDVDGNLISVSGKRQAILLLEGEENPDPLTFEVEGSFSAGAVINGHETRVYNPDVCSEIIENAFEVNRIELEYNVSDGNGFNITDNVRVTSSVDGQYKDYIIVSNPEWIILNKGTTVELINTLDININHNRDSDDPRSGNILLRQNDTGKEITITAFQWGRLHEGVPTEYPYTTTEYIQTVRGNPDNWNGDILKYREEYPIAQIGEQMWIRKSFFQPAVPNDYYNPIPFTETRKTNWMAAYPDRAFDFDVAEFNTFVGSHWGGQWAPRMITAFNDYQRIIWDTWNTSSAPGEGNVDYKDIDIKYIQQVPSYDDFYEMLGFIVAANWDGVSELTDDYVRGVCLKKSALKGSLDQSENGYDDVRYTYPPAWNRDVIMTGTDDYALAFFSSGGWSVHDESNTGENMKLLHLSTLQLLSDPPANVNYHNTFTYRIDVINPENWNEGVYSNYRDYPYGWTRGANQFSGFVAKPFRSVRYRELGYDIYSNGSDILKIDNEGAIPAGYTVIPKGALRGAWFGGFNKGVQKYSFDQLNAIASYINDNYIPNHKKLIG